MKQFLELPDALIPDDYIFLFQEKIETSNKLDVSVSLFVVPYFNDKQNYLSEQPKGFLITKLINEDVFWFWADDFLSGFKMFNVFFDELKKEFGMVDHG